MRNKGRKAGMLVHSWLNNPNTMRQICTRCGMVKETFTVQYKNNVLYTDRNGRQSTVWKPCKSKDDES